MKAKDYVTRQEFHAETTAIRGAIKNLALETIQIKGRLDKIEENMMTKEDGSRIIAHIDALAQKFEVFDRKVLTHDHRLLNLETQTAGHAIRLTRLESPQK